MQNINSSEILHYFNHFFNYFFRESNNPIIKFIWTTSILFGWIKIILETKCAIEFIIRHFVWKSQWK
jgi:hypothetical protein